MTETISTVVYAPDFAICAGGSGFIAGLICADTSVALAILATFWIVLRTVFSVIKLAVPIVGTQQTTRTRSGLIAFQTTLGITQAYLPRVFTGTIRQAGCRLEAHFVPWRTHPAAISGWHTGESRRALSVDFTGLHAPLVQLHANLALVAKGIIV